MQRNKNAEGRRAVLVQALILATVAWFGSSRIVWGQPASSQAAARQPAPVNVYAPPITGGPWINTRDGKAIDLESRKGKVTILHFWTFG